MHVKILTTAALVFVSLFFLSALGHAEEHYIYKDAQGKLVISNQQPPAGSNILRRVDLPEYRDLQMRQVQETGSTRSTGKLEGSPKQDQKK